MRKLFCAFCFLLFPLFSHAFNHRLIIPERIKQSKSKFEKRWNSFLKNNIEIPQWSYNWQEEDLLQRFEMMKKTRVSIYFVNPQQITKRKDNFKTVWKKGYKLPQGLDFSSSRYPYPIAFDYNLGYANYNVSIVHLNGLIFLAMDAPTEKNKDLFFKILTEYKVTDLLRLTPRFQDNKENCYPYWEGYADINSISNTTALLINSRDINYFPTDFFKGRKALPADKMLALVKAVQKSKNLDPKIIAVHCKAGISRTGTFIVAYALIDEIDKQIARGIAPKDIKINIDQMVWECFLQRPFAITRFSRYKSLYQMVNYYIDILSQHSEKK